MRKKKTKNTGITYNLFIIGSVATRCKLIRLFSRDISGSMRASRNIEDIFFVEPNESYKKSPTNMSLSPLDFEIITKN